MKGRFLVSSNEDPAEGNIYADKSALILDWLLREGVKKIFLKRSSQRNRSKHRSGSACFWYFGFEGTSQTEGMRTAKKFFFKKSKHLLESWLDHYSIVKKCKMRTYRSAFQKKQNSLMR